MVKPSKVFTNHRPDITPRATHVWTDDALCARMDSAAFFVDQDLTGRTARKQAIEAAEVARKVCVECPIRELCLEKSTPSDRYWTVRGGELPGRLQGRGSGKRAPSYNIDEWLPWTCRVHGPEFKKVRNRFRKDGRPYEEPFCGECMNEKKRGPREW